MTFHGRANAPLHIGARDGKIVQALLDERDHFVAAVIGLDELRIFFVQLEQRFLERGKLEEVVFFGHGFGGVAARGARIAGLDVVDVGFIADAIGPGIGALVNVPVLLAAFEQSSAQFRDAWDPKCG